MIKDDNSKLDMQKEVIKKRIAEAGQNKKYLEELFHPAGQDSEDPSDEEFYDNLSDEADKRVQEST